MAEPGETLTAGEQLVLHEADHARPTRIGIVDLGSQLLKPIDRRIREVGAETVIYPHTVTIEELLANCDAIVASGGGDSVNDEKAVWPDRRIYESTFPLPVLAICLGYQQMNHARGGFVQRGDQGRYGQRTIDIVDQDHPLLAGRGAYTKVLLNAGDCVKEDGLAPGLRVIAFSREGGDEIIAAFVDEDAPARAPKVGVQFHPEVDLTENGNDIFRRFINDIAGLPLNYTDEAKRDTVKRNIRTKVGGQVVASAASGGVDSAVLVAAVAEELGENQHVIHVDTGMMRKGESRLVLDAFEARDIQNVHFIDATNEFRHARTRYNGRLTRTLQYETDPEAKRHIFGDTFARIFDTTMKKLGLNPDTAFLAQGTLRPDLIESAGVGKSGKKIKTHHNDTPLLRAWRERGTVFEPLRDLHKDEVRKLGLELGLPDDVVWRQPFPGPGLGIRIICAFEPADFDGRPLVEDRLKGEFSDNDLSVHLLPIRTVGVQGDDRTYKHVAALSSNAEPDWQRYMEYATAIPQAVPEVSRVVYVFGDQVDRKRSLFGTVVRTSLRPEIVGLSQDVDHVVNEALREHNLIRKLAQEPVILAPIELERTGRMRKRMSILRPFVTDDFMVGSAAVPGSEKLPIIALHDQVEAALSISGISRVAIDLVGKPPGTVEWE